MAITRVTQKMLTDRSLYAINTNLSAMAATQATLNTGKRINKPSDDPTGTTVSLRARASLADQAQFLRNAQDGNAWLSSVDTALQTTESYSQRINALMIRGSSTATASTDSENALAQEIDQIKESLMAQANTNYLGRPIFGGTITGTTAYQQVYIDKTQAVTGSTMDDMLNGSGTQAGVTAAWTSQQDAVAAGVDPANLVVVAKFVGNSSQVVRRVGPDEVVAVNAPGDQIFGTGDAATWDATPDANGNPTNKFVAGADGLNIFQQLTNYSVDLRNRDTDAIAANVDGFSGFMSGLDNALAVEGASMNRITAATNVAQSQQLSLEGVRSTAEDADLAQATIALNTEQVAYQAALAATAKAVQPSLIQFLA